MKCQCPPVAVDHGSIIDAIGSGLIATGALLALAVVVFAPDDAGLIGQSEHDRQRRNANVGTLIAAATTLTGAVFVLIGSAWVYAFVGAIGAGILYFAALALVTHRDQRRLLASVLRDRQIDHNDAGEPGRITIGTAIPLLGLTGGFDVIERPDMWFGDVAQGGQWEALARERASLAWALRYPYGIQRAAPWRRPRTRP